MGNLIMQIFRGMKATREREQSVESFQKLVRAHARSGTDGQIHFADFFVDLFEEINDEINQTMRVHCLSVEICDEKANIVVLNR